MSHAMQYRSHTVNLALKATASSTQFQPFINTSQHMCFDENKHHRSDNFHQLHTRQPGTVDISRKVLKWQVYGGVYFYLSPARQRKHSKHPCRINVEPLFAFRSSRLYSSRLNFHFDSYFGFATEGGSTAISYFVTSLPLQLKPIPSHPSLPDCFPAAIRVPDEFYRCLYLHSRGSSVSFP